MAVIFARIRVADINHWRDAFDQGDPIRQEHGISVRAVYRDATYQNGVIVVMEAEDLDRAQEFYSSDAQRQRMARSGIERPAEMWMGTEF